MAEYICREAIIKDLEKEIEAGDAAMFYTGSQRLLKAAIDDIL